MNNGRFTEYSPFIKLIDRIVDARLEKKMKLQKSYLLPQENDEKKEEKKSKIKAGSFLFQD